MKEIKLDELIFNLCECTKFKMKEIKLDGLISIYVMYNLVDTSIIFHMSFL